MAPYCQRYGEAAALGSQERNIGPPCSSPAIMFSPLYTSCLPAPPFADGLVARNARPPEIIFLASHLRSLAAGGVSRYSLTAPRIFFTQNGFAASSNVDLQSAVRGDR